MAVACAGKAGRIPLAFPTVGELPGFAGGAVRMRAGVYGEERGRAVGLVSGGFQRAGRWSDRRPTVGMSARAGRAGESVWWVAGKLESREVGAIRRCASGLL